MVRSNPSVRSFQLSPRQIQPVNGPPDRARSHWRTGSGSAPAHPLGLLRVQNGYVVSAPRWIQPSEEGVEIGALATGEGDITDVGDDVSARHAHIWCDDSGTWFVEDLASTNGTVVVSGATSVCIQVEPGRSAQLNPGDELKLGESTTYAILLGAL